MKSLLSIFGILAVNALLGPSTTCIAQGTSFPIEETVKKLDARSDKKNEYFGAILGQLNATDSAAVFSILNELEKKGTVAGKYFQARFKCLKAILTHNKKAATHLSTKKNEIKNLFSQAIQLAYETGDEYLIAFVSLNYGGHMFAHGDIELATMYSLNAVELNDKLFGRNANANYAWLGEILFQTRDYEKTIYYSKKALENWKDTSSSSDYYRMSCLNTLALGYHRLGKYDSAFNYYNKALALSKSLNNELWTGILSGNMGQVYFLLKKYDSARFLLEYDYRISKQYGYLENAANSLQWAARVNIAQGNKKPALQQVKEALNLLEKKTQVYYLQNTYYTAAEVYRALSLTDSFFRYSGLYMALHDSLERVIILSSNNIAKMRFNDEKNQHGIQNLLREKEAQKQQRNLIISGIIVLAGIAMLITNKKRLQAKHHEELLLQQKLVAEAEVRSARDQLKMFTQNIIEKTLLIETLEQQLSDKVKTAEQQQIISDLSAQTILTEQHWEQFKILYEKIYPGFFIHLKEKVNDITVAEQRMAALTRLQLTTKQMASMLGISVDSVHKTRQRLRHRLHLTPETNLEEFVSTV